MTGTKMTITCKDTTWLVSDACERDLTPQEKANLQNHIAECDLCKGASKQFEVMFRQLDLYLGKDNRNK
ncbi:MAG: zf-HC2 domain-containing protein [Hyphomicrobiaceae bacterium]